jgi:glycosyltransferase involved in cell wall biosynthesis
MVMGRINVFFLVHNRMEYTRLALKHLYRFTNFDLVNRLVFVDDNSTDGAEKVCEDYLGATGKEEIVHIQAGTVTGALYHGSAHTTLLEQDEGVEYMVKLDNDLILAEEWLDKVCYLLQQNRWFDVVGFLCPGEFFPGPPELVWKKCPYYAHYIRTVPYTGGNFIMRWPLFIEQREDFLHLAAGVGNRHEDYSVGSICSYQERLSREEKLRIGAIHPHLPVFKLDKCLHPRWEVYEFYKKRGINRQHCWDLVEVYRQKGYSRKSQGQLK